MELGPPPTLSIRSVSASPNPTDEGLIATFSVTASGGTPPYSYNWSGVPPGCPSAAVSRFTCVPTATGTFDVTVEDNDSSGASASATLGVVVLPAPAILGFTASPSSVVLGASTDLAVIVSGGLSPYSFGYAGLPPGCLSANQATLTCSPTAAGNFTVQTTVVDALGVNATAFTTLDVTRSGTNLTISSLFVFPSNITLGSSAVFVVQSSGGEPPLAYAYLNLPSGCASQNTALLLCTPASSGSYAVDVTVTDGLNRSASAITVLTVAAPLPTPLVVLGFIAYPSTIGLGNFTVLVILATGGVAPLAYGYQGLPPGCLALPLPVVLCRPTSAGEFSVDATVTDAAGHSASSAVELSVVGATVVPPAAGSAGPSPLAIAEYVGLGAVAGAAGVLAAVVLRRRFARR